MPKHAYTTAEWVRLGIVGALVLFVYGPTFGWMYERWMVTGSYYSHGPLVPLICAFLIWQQRAKLAAMHYKGTRLGWVFLLAGLFVHLLSSLWQVYFSSGFSLLLTIAGVVLLFLGRRFLRQTWFSLAFLTFMIPLPEVLISNASFRLKLFAASIATFAVNRMGIPAMRQGSVIQTRHAVLTVEDPCSGIRSLIALIALGALMAYMSKLTRAKKITLFATTLPIAILSNVVRIILLTAVSEIYGTEAAMGWFHDFTGFAVFALAFLGLILLSKILE